MGLHSLKAPIPNAMVGANTVANTLALIHRGSPMAR